MVGVPGRSKGCHTCKKRKKKCDLERPICRNCTKGGFVCGGYEKAIVMVHADEQGRGSYHQQLALQRTHGIRPALNASILDSRYKKLNRTASELECFELFRQGMIPVAPDQGKQAGAIKDPAFFDEWWARTFDSATKNELTRCALLSASEFLIGHLRMDYMLRNRGLELYHESIKLMSRELTLSRFPKSSTKNFDLLMAGFLLETFEYTVREFPDITERTTPAERFRTFLIRRFQFYGGGDIRISVRSRGHVQCMMSLVSNMDPEVFSHPSLHQMFLQFRQIWICLSFENRRSTFLSSEDWCTKPWIGLNKSLIDTLWDNMVFVPDLLEACDQLSLTQPGHDQCEQATRLWNRICRLEQAADNWQDELSTACHSMTFEEAAYLRECINTMALEDLPEVLVRQGPWCLLAWMLHWALHLVLMGLKPLVLMRLPDDTHPISHDHESIATYSLGIARAARFMFNRDPAELGIVHYAFLRVPVAVVQQLLQIPLLRSTNDPKLTEAEIILRSIGTEEWELEMRVSSQCASAPPPFVLEVDDTDSAYSSESAW